MNARLAQLAMRLALPLKKVLKPSDLAAFSGEQKSFHDFSALTLRGKKLDLSTLRGKIVLIVNTASECGLTGQYQTLQDLHETYAARGLVILGFPSNEFGSQEPGGNNEIESFCQLNYGVTFQMMAKIVVKGEGIDPLYHFLCDKSQPRGEISWNFEKFLIAADGSIAARFAPYIPPKDKKLLRAIETLLP